jgi:GMP reductase
MGSMDAFNKPVGIDNICIDVANGYTEHFLDFVAKARYKYYQDDLIMAGNVATPNQAESLIMAGADIVKVGIGPGSVCTTRKMAGVGYPQLSAVMECADAVHGIGGMICADGGCTDPGDVAKAFAAGADFVMLGGMLAGHNECSGDFVFEDGSILEDVSPKELLELKRTKPIGMRFYGMSSAAAQEKYYNGVSKYKAAEGKEVFVPYRGFVDDTISEILGGIRSSMTYIGASRLKDIPKCATFVRTTSQLNNVFS